MQRRVPNRERLSGETRLFEMELDGCAEWSEETHEHLAVVIVSALHVMDRRGGGVWDGCLWLAQ